MNLKCILLFSGMNDKPQFSTRTAKEYLNTNENLVLPQRTFVASEICIRSNPTSLYVMVLIN